MKTVTRSNWPQAPLTQRLPLKDVKATDRQPVLTTSQGPDFFTDPLDRPVEILVVGIDREENQISRAVQQYGFTYRHLNGSGIGNGSSTKNWPKSDAAVIVLSHASHRAYWDLKEEFRARGKKVFFVQQGFSEIKMDFEHHFLKFIRDLEGLDVSMNARLYFLLGFYVRKIGAKFHRKDFQDFCDRVLKEKLFGQAMGNFLMDAKAHEYVEGGGDRGNFTFKGFTPDMAKRFQERMAKGVPIPQAWVNKPSSTAAMFLPEVKIEEPQPIMVVEAPVPLVVEDKTPVQEVLPVAVVPPSSQKLSIEENLELVGMGIEETMERQRRELETMMAAKKAEIQEIIKRKIDVPGLLTKINAKLPTMSPEKVQAVWELIG